MFAQTLTTEQYTCWNIDIKTLETFSNDSYVIGFTDRFLSEDIKGEVSESELESYQQLVLIFYNAVIKDQMHALPIYLSIANVSLMNLINRLTILFLFLYIV